VYLDEVTEFNGPLFLIPGSHHRGVASSMLRSATTGEPERKQHVSATDIRPSRLQYSLSREDVMAAATERSIIAPKGRAGAVLFFHANIYHGSVPNMSPFDRAVVIVTYNSVENRLVPRGVPRPDFLAEPDASPIVPVLDDALVPARADSGLRVPSLAERNR